MPRQVLEFDILAHDSASKGFLSAGRAASAASDDVMGLARRLDEISKKTADARVTLSGDKEAQVQLDKLSMRMLAVGRKVTADVSIEGAAKASAEITGLDVQLDHLTEKAGKSGAAGAIGDLAGGGAGAGAGAGGAMGALIAAGAALSPVLVTVGLGTAGFGLAAAGAVAPVIKAAQAAGGLQKNMAKLDPEQRQVARGLLGLGKQYHAFEQALQPVVLHDFGLGLQFAGHVMHDLEPVSKATGIAIGGLLGAIDKELASGTWQQFFGWMAKNVGPDVKLVTSNLTDLMKTLPPLLETLQPVATGLLTLTDDFLKAAHGSAVFLQSLTSLDQGQAKTQQHAGFWSQLWHGYVKDVRMAENATADLVRWIPGLSESADKAAASGGHAAAGVHAFGMAAAATQPPVFDLAKAVTALTASMQKNVGEVLTLQGDEIQWRQSLQAATVQLHSNSAGLDGNTKNALANKAAVLQATQNVMTFADDQLTLGGNLNAASRRIQEQIHWLQVHGEHSAFARREITALRLEEDKLRATIRQRILVTGTGTWHVAHGLGARGTGVAAASGWRVPGFGGGDRWPALLEGGEAVVPKHLVEPLAPFLKANKVPGFAAGGFAGTVPGLGKWLASEDSSTLRALEAAVAGAVKGALAGVGGGGSTALGGDPGANQALARRMYPPWGSGAQWAAWNLLNLAESGWNRWATNPTSGAFGIPQALPPTKMPFAAQAAGGAHAGPQIGWQLGYISSTYRDPAGAWAHERALHWYGDGLHATVRRPMFIGVGERGPERVDITPGGEDLGPLLRKLIKQTGHMIALLEAAPGLQAQATTRALNGLVPRIPAPRARGR